ncbi:MAG TPA: NAD-dependent epimerase/dehydratase family protein [Victivallales bacterium]|nr:NAD-dependent epimerase/dehydratase family protein [Victivallales bacterium]
MKVCVIGGTGNISKSIVRVLLENGHEVTCYNRGKRATVPKDVRLICGDRNLRDEFEKTMRAETFDAVIDMICFNAEDAKSDIRAFPHVGQLIHCSTVCTYGIEYLWFPVTEDHPLRPITDYGRNKVAADSVFLEAYYRDAFPVTIIKPSTTYGPRLGLLRQVALDFSWIDRIRKGKPIIVCGDGNALHQFLHVDDAALAFCGVLGKPHCIGQIYNMTKRGFTSWLDYHRTAMKVLGRDVEMIGVPLQILQKQNIPNFGLCQNIFAHITYYSSEKIFRDVPEFKPEISLESGMKKVLETAEFQQKIPDSDTIKWEDEIISMIRK